MKKKPIAVNILYKHTKKTHKTIYPRQQMPTKQATDSSVVISLHQHSHTYHLFHANVKRVKTNPEPKKKTIENTKQTGI